MANSRKLSKKAVQSELMTLATVAGGMVAGTLAVNAAEKVLKVDAGSKLPKRLIAPVAVAAGGAILSVKSTNPMIKRAAVGAGAAGVLRTMKAVAPNTTLLNGLGGEDDHLGLTPTSAIAQNEDWVYRDSSGHLAFPELGEVTPPQSDNGYLVDAPAYLGESREDAGMLGPEDSGILGIEDAQIL